MPRFFRRVWITSGDPISGEIRESSNSTWMRNPAGCCANTLALMSHLLYWCHSLGRDRVRQRKTDAVLDFRRSELCLLDSLLIRSRPQPPGKRKRHHHFIQVVVAALYRHKAQAVGHDSAPPRTHCRRLVYLPMIEPRPIDRKRTPLNSSHSQTSYA